MTTHTITPPDLLQIQRHQRCDPRALQLATALKQREDPPLLILFGSRVRGDWKEASSDIDIMVITDGAAEWDDHIRVNDSAIAIAKEIFTERPPVQTIVFTTKEFDRLRRSINHVAYRALQEGIIMPRNPDDYSYNYDNDEDDLSYNWTVTGERLRHAHDHLNQFIECVDDHKSDLLIGREAHDAMEHALKALISVHGVQYPPIHEIGILTDHALKADPNFQFIHQMDPRYYDQYAGHDEYKPPRRPISRLSGYDAAVASDVQKVVDRVNEIGSQQGYQSSPTAD